MEYLMLSELIEKAQAVMSEHGDMHVWLKTCVAGYEFNEDHTVPAVHPHDGRFCDKTNINKREGYFSSEASTKSFLLSGW